MKTLFLLFFLVCSFSSWGECHDINSRAEIYQNVISTSESGYVVSDNARVYFYSAPDERCKIKDLFIIHGDLVDVYSEYKGFLSVIFFKKNGETVDGWVHSSSIKPTGTGIGPRE